ncbi:MAG TPA: glycosyltransferase [Allosphingosinicella sp.]|jgi:glycosyltransferase involved in cell wall biosynthesis
MVLRVVVLSSRFPDRLRPNLGLFVERQTLGLAARPDVEPRVVAPVEMPPALLARLAGNRAARALAALPEAESWKGLEVYRPRCSRLPGLPRSRPARMAARLLPLLRGLRESFAFEAIAAEFFWPDGPAARRLAAALGVPFSVKARGGDLPIGGRRGLSRREIVAAGEAAGGMLAVSAGLREAMIGLGLPGERIAVHHTGIDRSLFHPRDRAAAKAALGVEGPLLLTVGTIGPLKGQDLAVEALQWVEGATLMVAGGGTRLAALRAKVEALGLGARVRLLGSVPHALLPQFYAAADATLLASRAEGLANSLVESLACGTPVVTTDVFGARDLVDRPEAGRIAARDPAAFAAAIAELLADPPPPEAVSAAADKFSWDANAAQLEAHLRGIVREAGR